MQKVLKQQAKELENYVKAKHTQEECIGFIDGFERANELFALYSVSQHRELLIGYIMNEQRLYCRKPDRKLSEELADDYIANL